MVLGGASPVLLKQQQNKAIKSKTGGCPFHGSKPLTTAVTGICLSFEAHQQLQLF